MKVLKNTSKKQVFVQLKNDSINTYITVPLAGAHTSTKLTIRSGNTRLDLNGRQVNTLRAVLAKSQALGRSSTRTVTTARSRSKTTARRATASR